jgi:hypothetical protein
MALSRCGTRAVSFLPQVLRFPADFWAGWVNLPNLRHGTAIRLPQTEPAITRR